MGSGHYPHPPRPCPCNYHAARAYVHSKHEATRQCAVKLVKIEPGRVD